jgi:N-acyl-D-amino-acid deacylase
MEIQLLIKNGTIVDGTGAPAFRSDRRVPHGRISEIAPSLEAEGRERLIDASGCYVAAPTAVAP